MNKKVLFLRTPPYDLSPNSYNVQQVGIGKAFCKLGYDFDFITFKKENQSEWVFYENNRYKARWIEKPRTRILRMGINKSICNEEFLSQYDLIISQEYYQIMTYMLSKRSSNVIMYSGPYWNMFMLPFMSKVYDLLFTKSMNTNLRGKFAKSDLAKEFLEKKGYTNVHNIGVALDSQRFDECIEMTADTKRVVDYMNSNRCILYVGALDSNKNYPFLLKVYEKLLETDPDLKFVVIGKSRQSIIPKLLGKSDVSFEQECYSKVSETVKKGIYRMQRIENPQLKYVYPLAKAFLLPSKHEIFGMVLLEAMYLGAPVVTSRNGGSTTLIEGRNTGKIIDEFDETKWTNAIKEYLDNDEDTSIITENAKKLIANDFNWDSIVKRMLELIENG